MAHVQSGGNYMVKAFQFFQRDDKLESYHAFRVRLDITYFAEN